MEFQKTHTEARPEASPGQNRYVGSAARRHQIGSDRPAPFAAVVYPAKKGDRKGLARFVQSLKQSKARVGGVIQEKTALGNDGMQLVEAVDIRTGWRIPLNRPTPETWHNRECSLDASALVETTAMLRAATDDCVDLIVVEKFGDAERRGEGLTDEILQAIAAGIPLLIAVPETNLEAWTELSGGMGAVVSCEENALHEWWAAVQREYANSAVGMSS